MILIGRSNGGFTGRGSRDMALGCWHFVWEGPWLTKDFCWKVLCGCSRHGKKSETLDANQKCYGRKVFFEQKY